MKVKKRVQKNCLGVKEGTIYWLTRIDCRIFDETEVVKIEMFKNESGLLEKNKRDGWWIIVGKKKSIIVRNKSVQVKEKLTIIEHQ